MGEIATRAGYSSRIIKAGALLTDTRLMLETWDLSEDIQGNLARIRQANILGKTSRSRVEDVLAIFRQRYLERLDLLEALVVIANSSLPSEVLDRILYVQAARSDRLLHDVVTDCLYDRHDRLDRRVRPDDVQRWIAERVDVGETERPWSEAVQRRVTQGLLATLRDFGVLEGQNNKSLAYLYLPSEAFAFAALQLRLSGCSSRELLESPEWRLFLVPEGTVDRLFLEAHRDGLLEYNAAGSVVRIDFPAPDLTEYAGVLARR